MRLMFFIILFVFSNVIFGQADCNSAKEISVESLNKLKLEGNSNFFKIKKDNPVRKSFCQIKYRWIDFILLRVNQTNLYCGMESSNRVSFAKVVPGQNRAQTAYLYRVSC